MVAFHPPTKKSPNGFLSASNECKCPSLAGDYIQGSGLEVPKLKQPDHEINPTALNEIKHAGQSGTCRPGDACYRPPTTVNYSQSFNQWQGKAGADAIARQHGANLVTVADRQTNSLQCYGSLQGGRLWVASRSSRTTAYSGPNCFLAVAEDMSQGTYTPGSQPPAVSPVQPSPQPASTPSGPAPSVKAGRYQIALFLGNDSKSQSLKQWFTTNPSLAKLKENCAYEEYTVNNPLYQTRGLARIIEPKDFPAIIFQQPDGGHVYAAGGPMLPHSDAILLSDLRKGYELARSVQTAPTLVSSHSLSGAMRESGGYSWDDAINPGLQLPMTLRNPLQSDECVDGNCDPQNQPWRPGDKIRDVLNRAEDQKNVLLWASSPEIVNIVLVIAILVAAFLLYRKLSA